MMGAFRQRLARMGNLDRRVIYGVMAAAVVLPFLTPVTLSVHPSERTVQFADALDTAIASDRPIMIELVFGNQTMAEMEPITLAVMHRLFKAKKPTIFFTTYETAAAFTRRYLAQMEKEYNLTYGEDYAFLGYAASWTIAMYKLGDTIEEVYHEDDRGTPIYDLPIMKGMHSLEDAAALIDIAGNSNPRFWINYAVTPHDIDFLMAATAVEATNYYPFLQTGQVKGLIAGGRAGAEYEAILVEKGILDRPGDATRNLGSQSLALMVILGFIVLGNIGYFAGSRKPKGDTR